MRNQPGGYHQFSTNIRGSYEIAVISDVILSGPDSRLAQLDYFLGTTASLRGITDAIYLGPALSRDEAERWPRTGITTRSLAPLPNGHLREDLVLAPHGFVLANQRGHFMPIFLHREIVVRPTPDPAIHLIGGLPLSDEHELPDGGIEVSIGTAAIVELELSETGELFYETTFWQLDTAPHNTWPLDVE